MKIYKTNSIVTIPGGEIGLSDIQAEKRKHLLKSGKRKGVYIAVSPVTFKAGEIISLPAVNKALAAQLDEVAGK